MSSIVEFYSQVGHAENCVSHALRSPSVQRAQLYARRMSAASRASLRSPASRACLLLVALAAALSLLLLLPRAAISMASASASTASFSSLSASSTHLNGQHRSDGRDVAARLLAQHHEGGSADGRLAEDGVNSGKPSQRTTGEASDCSEDSCSVDKHSGKEGTEEGSGSSSGSVSSAAHSKAASHLSLSLSLQEQPRPQQDSGHTHRHTDGGDSPLRLHVAGQAWEGHAREGHGNLLLLHQGPGLGHGRRRRHGHGHGQGHGDGRNRRHGDVMGRRHGVSGGMIVNHSGVHLHSPSHDRHEMMTVLRQQLSGGLHSQKQQQQHLLQEQEHGRQEGGAQQQLQHGSGRGTVSAGGGERVTRAGAGAGAQDGEAKGAAKGEEEEEAGVWRRRQAQVVSAFRHAWLGYKAFAFGFDELRPMSQRGEDGLGGLGATIVDALDTAMLMSAVSEGEGGGRVGGAALGPQGGGSRAGEPV